MSIVSSVEVQDFDVLIRAAKEALLVYKERYAKISEELEKARLAYMQVQQKAESLSMEQRSLERIIELQTNVLEHSNSVFERHLAISKQHERNRIVHSSLSEHTIVEVEAEEVTENVATDEQSPKRRLNVRSRMISLIEEKRKCQNARDIYELACADFKTILPISTVNGGLSKLVEEKRLMRFPSSQGRGSLYGPPAWFEAGQPKMEFIPDDEKPTFASMFSNLSHNQSNDEDEDPGF